MSNKLKDVVIVGAIRTPIGAYKGSLKDVKAHQLGSTVINEVLKKSKIGWKFAPTDHGVTVPSQLS